MNNDNKKPTLDISPNEHKPHHLEILSLFKQILAHHCSSMAQPLFNGVLMTY